MLAYAANRPVVAARRSSPNALLAVIAAHVALVAAVMSVKMDLPEALKHTPTVIDFIDEPLPAEHVDPPVRTTQHNSVVTRPRPLVPTPPTGGEIVDSTPTPPPHLDDPVGPTAQPEPTIRPQPRPQPTASEARLLTPPSQLKPPYPPSKLLTEEEAVLTLRLTIDERGQVVAVEPVGRADRTFLEAARRHVLAKWRYRPATEAGRAVPTSTVVTLRFQLDA